MSALRITGTVFLDNVDLGRLRMPATDIFSPAAPADATAGTPATDPALKSSDALHDRVFKVLLDRARAWDRG